MSRSNMFANHENKFEFASKEELIAIALSSAKELSEQINGFGFGDQMTFMLLIIGTKLGVAGDGDINSDEEELIDEVFGRLWNGDMSEVYDMIEIGISDDDYEIVSKITQLGNHIAMPFLYYVFSFAYIDGEFEDEVAEKLDSLFGKNFLVDFMQSSMEDGLVLNVTPTMQSGMEKVPAPGVRLTGFEAEIVQWFQERGKLIPLREIVAHFPDKTKSEVQKAMDSLFEKGVVYGGAGIVGNLYGLDDSLDFYFDERKQEEEDRRLEEAQKYGVSEEDLDKHITYLEAKETLKKAKHSKDYDDASKQFGSVKGYLDSDSLKKECDEKSKELKPFEKAKDEFDKATKKCNDADKKHKEAEELYKKAEADRNAAATTLSAKKESYESDKMQLEQTHNKNISECENKVSEAENKVANDKRSLEEARTELAETFALAFGKKKTLRLKIADLETEIPSDEKSVISLKYKVRAAKSGKTKALAKLEAELKALESSSQKAESAFDEAKKKLISAKNSYDTAKDDLESKKKAYESIKQIKMC